MVFNTAAYRVLTTATYGVRQLVLATVSRHSVFLCQCSNEDPPTTTQTPYCQRVTTCNWQFLAVTFLQVKSQKKGNISLQREHRSPPPTQKYCNLRCLIVKARWFIKYAWLCTLHLKVPWLSEMEQAFGAVWEWYGTLLCSSNDKTWPI